MKTSSQLKRLAVYSRAQLKDRFGIIDSTINNGVFRPKGHDSIWLFVTENKTPDRTQFNDKLTGDILEWDGQTGGRTDDLIINHKAHALEILVFYRKEKNEHSGAGFRYEGPFEYVSHTGSAPSHFKLRRESISTRTLFDLAYATDVETIRANVTEFNECLNAQPQVVWDLLASDRFWVYDPKSSQFAPSSFSVFAGIKWQTFSLAFDAKRSSVQNDFLDVGDRAWELEISETIGRPFGTDPELYNLFVQWRKGFSSAKLSNSDKDSPKLFLRLPFVQASDPTLVLPEHHESPLSKVVFPEPASRLNSQVFLTQLAEKPLVTEKQKDFDKEEADAYFRWNASIISTVTENCSPDEPVFLAIDSDRIGDIAMSHDICGREQARQSFLDEVRSSCLIDGRVNTQKLRGVYKNGQPRGVAFLAFLVLAASERGDAGDDRFYLSLSKLLWPKREKPGSTRQEISMPAGGECEEPLWRSWNSWLLQNDFKPTARRGSGPRDKFRMYPTSQVTLSNVEKRYLQNDVISVALSSKELPRDLDLPGFEMWLRRRVQKSPGLWKAISDRIRGRDHLGGHLFPQAFRDAFLSECHALYADASVQETIHCPIDQDGRSNLGLQKVIAGLAREACLDGTVEYRLRPRKPVRSPLTTNASVHINGIDYPLTLSDDPNWFVAIGDPLATLENQQWVVRDFPNIERMELPRRDFWILAPDPNSPSDQLLVSGRRPDPDERFTVLVNRINTKRDSIVSTMHRCKDLGLIEWESFAQMLGNWVEFRRCRILVSPWREEPPTDIDPEFYLSIAPEMNDSIRWEGGLRRPNMRNAFMQGCLPNVVVVTEADPIFIAIAHINEPDKALFAESYPRGKPFTFRNDLPPGDYVLHAFSGDDVERRELSSRRLTVSSWIDLSFESICALQPSRIPTPEGTLEISGSRFQLVPIISDQRSQL